MKNIFNITRSIIVGAVLVSCASDLDVKPAINVNSLDAIKTSKDVKGLLIGAYSNMGGANLYGGGVYVYSDLLASDIINGTDINFFGTFQELSQMANKEIPIDNIFVSRVWLNAYATINTANEVLNSLSLVESLSKDRVEGEAKFIRASMYFELVKLYGRAWNDGDPTKNPGVPLVLVPTHSYGESIAHPSRSTVKAVYDQIISDLNDAERLLPISNSESYYFVTTGAAAAQLSRIYLVQGLYNLALAAANRVISSNAYELVNNYADEFPYEGTPVRITNKSEDIFAVQVSDQQGINNLNTYYATGDFGGRGDIEISQDFIDTFYPGDTRTLFFEDDGTGFGLSYTHKFDNQFGNVKILRLAEMYLTRAECNLRGNTSVGDTPLNDINRIRSRAGIPTLTSVALQDVLDERRLELAFEGQWLVDAKRTQSTVSGMSWDAPQLIFPIPQRERIENPNLSQNVGY